MMEERGGGNAYSADPVSKSPGRVPGAEVKSYESCEFVAKPRLHAVHAAGVGLLLLGSVFVVTEFWKAPKRAEARSQYVSVSEHQFLLRANIAST